MSGVQANVRKKVNDAGKGSKAGSGAKRPPSGKPVTKQSEKEKKLKEENKKLKDKIVMLGCNLDPIKIMKELDLSDQSMINMLTEANLELRSELKNYTCEDSKKSSSTPQKPSTKQQPDVESGGKNQTELLLKQEGELLDFKNKVQELQKENDQLKLEKSRHIQISQDQEQLDVPKHYPALLQENSNEIETLKENINELSQEKEKVNMKLLTAEQSVQDKTNIIESIETEKTKVQQDKKKLEQEYSDYRQEKDKEVKKLVEEKEIVENDKKELEIEMLRLRDKQKETLAEDMKNGSTNAEMRKVRDKDIENELEIKRIREECKKKIDDNEKKARDKDIENELEIKTIKEECKKKINDNEKKATDQNKEKELEIEKSKDEYKKLTDEKEKTIKQLRKDLDEAKHSAKKNAEANGLQDEIDELKNRLSKVVGANIMNDNPNITDLSDENRPTKLSEKFSELYDNEWTDAYEEAESEFRTEEKGIEHLYKTLLDVFEFCKKKSVEHAKNIRNCVMTLPNSPNARPKSAEIGVTNQRQLKEIRKSFAPMLVESVFQNYSKEKKLNLTKKENTGKFIKRCVEICWLMNSQDPPVILDTSVVTGKSFDADKYRTYTKTGKVVDYVVWPPMILHKDGPMLCKGVAQGK